MLVDLSHVGDRSTMEAIEASKDPVCFTHVLPGSDPKELSPYAAWASRESPLTGQFVRYAKARVGPMRPSRPAPRREG